MGVLATIFSSDVVWTWISRCFQHFRKGSNSSVFGSLFGSGYAGLGREEAGTARVRIGRVVNPIRVACRKFRSAVHKVRVERFYVLDTAPNRIKPRISIEFKCFERLDEGLASQLARVKGRKANWQRRFDLGHRCYLALYKGEPVGFGWVSLSGWLIGNEQPLGSLAGDVAFGYDGITCEPWRGNRIASARLAYEFHDMQRLGFERSCLLIADENRASQRSSALVGYRRTESVVRIHRWMMVHRTLEGGPPAEVLP